MNAWDSANPIPHPGFRAGQLWAVSDPLSEAGFEIEAIEGHVTNGLYPWRWRGERRSEEEMHELLRDAFLLADPACPHLAPWSPPA